eukprot:Rmarinus@m.2580
MALRGFRRHKSRKVSFWNQSASTVVGPDTADPYSVQLEDEQYADDMQVHSSKLGDVRGTLPMYMREAREQRPRSGTEFRSLFLFSPQSSLRAKVSAAVLHPLFDFCVMICIFLNCILLALADPVNPDSARNDFLETLEMPFTFIFTLEFVFKSIMLGFILHEGSYLRDPWNVLDFVVVATSLFAFVGAGIDGITALRTMRILRPLKTIQRFPDMRRLVVTLLQSLPMLLSVLGVIAFVFVVFSIFGVQMFSGSLRGNCFYDGELPFGEQIICGAYECPTLYFNSTIGTEGDCVKSSRNPNPHYGITNYDHIGWALLTTFQAVTLEGWTDIMYMMQDGAHSAVWIYFVLLVFLGSFFVVNLMLAVISTTFSQLNHDSESENPEGDAMEAKLSETTLATYSQARRILYYITSHSLFGHAILLCIILNTITMSMSHHNEPQGLTDYRTYSNYVFTAIFALEMVLKIISTGVREHFRVNPNRFDAIIVIGSLVEVVVPGSAGVSVLRGFRLLRVLKLIRTQKELAKIVNTIASSLLPLANFTALFSLFLFVYTLIGMTVYGGQFDNGRTRSTFDDFVSSFSSVFQIVTGEDWNRVMYEGINCCSTVTAVLYFVSCFVLGNYILLNLFLAILLSHFEKERSPEENEPEMDVFTAEEEAEQEPVASTNVQDKLNLQGKSFGIFSTDSPLRLSLAAIVSHRHYEAGLLCLIALSCLNLAMDDSYVDPDSLKGKLIALFDVIFTIAFTAEMLGVMVVYGVYQASNAYLRNAWCRLDFLIVLVSWLNIGLSGVDLSFLKSLRALRALRPLRVISRVPELKMVVNALFRTVKPMLHVLLLSLLVFMIFGVMGVELWKGLYYYCLGDGEFVRYSLDREACEAHPDYRWHKLPANFDHILAALMTLFEVSTLEGWVDIMWVAVDTTEIDHHPVENNNRVYIMFFILFIIVGAFFLLNLFVGVVIDTFLALKKEYDGSAFLTEEQRNWVETQKLILQQNAKQLFVPPESPWRRRAFEVAIHRYFNGIVLTCIMLNALLMAVRHYNMSDEWELLSYAANTGFTIFFLIEAIIKMIAFTPVLYFRDSWNCFDFVIVIASLPSIFLVRSSNIAFVRIVRIARIFKIIKSAQSIRTLMRTLYVSLPTLLNVGSLLLLLFLIYAVLGMNLFGDVRYGESLNRHANFRAFWGSMLTLLRMCTGESWNGIMDDASISERCDGVSPEDEYFQSKNPLNHCCFDGSFRGESINNCGYSFRAPLYFFSFQLFGGFIMLNLFIAVVLENFESFSQTQNQLRSTHLEAYKRHWSILDPQATMRIPVRDLQYLLFSLGPPLGIPLRASRRTVRQIMKSLNLPSHGGYIYFTETLHALCSLMCGTDLPLSENIRHAQELLLARRVGELKKNEASSGTVSSLAEYEAARMLQLAWRRYKAMHRIKKLRRRTNQEKVRDIRDKIESLCVLVDSLQNGDDDVEEAHPGVVGRHSIDFLTPRSLLAGRFKTKFSDQPHRSAGIINTSTNQLFNVPKPATFLVDPDSAPLPKSEQSIFVTPAKLKKRQKPLPSLSSRHFSRRTVKQTRVSHVNFAKTFPQISLSAVAASTAPDETKAPPSSQWVHADAGVIMMA